ncbi:MAG: 5-formyltetrahydrofolate cyclo-ligase [Bacteroidota bacterium]
MDKNSIRKKYKERRNAMSLSDLETASIAIANRSLELPIWSKQYYHIFLPISEKREVDTEFLLHILQGRDKSVVVSKTHFTTHTMQHFLLQENRVLKLSDYGIPEPVAGIEVPLETLDVVFVPLLAFDEQGGRIGYGKGFYDQFLAQCKEETIFVGLSFFESEQAVPTDPQDIPLHFCITPKRIYTFKNSSYL